MRSLSTKKMPQKFHRFVMKNLAPPSLLLRRQNSGGTHLQRSVCVCVWRGAIFDFGQPVAPLPPINMVWGIKHCLRSRLRRSSGFSSFLDMDTSENNFTVSLGSISVGDLVQIFVFALPRTLPPRSSRNDCFRMPHKDMLS